MRERTEVQEVLRWEVDGRPERIVYRVDFWTVLSKAEAVSLASRSTSHRREIVRAGVPHADGYWRCPAPFNDCNYERLSSENAFISCTQHQLLPHPFVGVDSELGRDHKYVQPCRVIVR